MSKRALPALLAGLVSGLAVAACERPAPPPASDFRPPTAAEQACVNQGFARRSNAYDQCMARENAIGRPLPPPVVAPPEGVFAFKDEYGFRYDALGNRLDAQGKVISPHTP
jgi:hypothetical protein